MSRLGELLAFWFADGPDVWRPIWFRRDDAFDAAIRARFAATARDAAAGVLDAWADDAHGALALVIALDQLPRNLHRGSASAFAADPLARRWARHALARGFDTVLPVMQRMFLYLPFEHSERMVDQDQSVRLFEAMADDPRMSAPDGPIDYVHLHREVIRRFGRFPHRNAALGRASTEEEREYLTRPDAGF